MAEEPIAFEVNGVSYQARRMDLFTQISIATKLAPLMANGLAQILRIVAIAQDHGLANVLALPKAELLEHLVPLAAELAKMPEADQRFIIASTLAGVQKQNGTATKPQWASVWPAGMTEAAFPEFRTDLFLTMRVVATVLMATLGPFTLGSR